jgi:FkbM family methyltransferase
MWYGDNNYNRHTNGEYRLLKILMPSAKVVFDVGANIGEYSGEILKINSLIIIHAFEPGSAVFGELKKLKLVANNFAMGNKSGKHLLYQEKERSTHNSFYSFNDNTLKPVEVEVQTIDEYCIKNNIKHIDFLKIDVEGFEYPVLIGAEKMLADRAVDYIQFEFSGATIESRVYLKDFMLLFKEYGYDLHRIRGTSVDIVDYYPDRERFTLTNYLAVKQGLTVE